jgi:hypothetical protein
MIAKSGSRFSSKIMRKKNVARRVTHPNRIAL